ncbi:RidA family protein [Reinekea thalattae]|uniref:RidA family protein n=1 Tax=Reinekea thalattae TaxID=2593301 RepID=A0A5C8Z953_9GAMM|nr:RidA family protein [Reinekea thalattae]TXR53681.1 RidA family protein [Reinekea thalattae]
MTIITVNPKTLYDATPNGMSQATISTEHGLVFVSGQVDWSVEHEISANSIAGQARAAFENLKLALEAAGSSLNHLLQVRIYVRGEVSEYMAELGPVLKEYLESSKPALTGVGVSSLAAPELLIEIEAVACRA